MTRTDPRVILAMMADSKNRHNIRVDIEMKDNSMRWTGTDAEQELTYSNARQPRFRHMRTTFRHVLKCGDRLENALVPLRRLNYGSVI